MGMIVCMALVPESPKWLLIRGKKEEAKATMILLRPENHDVETEVNIRLYSVYSIDVILTRVYAYYCIHDIDC